ncbi:hypothetical protein ACQPW3_25360 [Actinosynnema sp. CA-248983]
MLIVAPGRTRNPRDAFPEPFRQLLPLVDCPLDGRDQHRCRQLRDGGQEVVTGGGVGAEQMKLDEPRDRDIDFGYGNAQFRSHDFKRPYGTVANGVVVHPGFQPVAVRTRRATLLDLVINHSATISSDQPDVQPEVLPLQPRHPTTTPDAE